MTSRKAVSIKLADIQQTFFVRVELNVDRVQYFRGLFEANADVEPIQVTRKTHQLVSGRHRTAGAKEAGREEVMGYLIDEAPLPELIIMSFTENLGGPLPPSQADINHALRLLLDQGVSRRRLLDMLTERTSLPRKLLIRHLDDVQSDMAKTRLAKAVEAVTDGGFSVPAASGVHGVEEATLRARLKGLRRPEMGLDVIKARISGKFKGFSSTNAKMAKGLIVRFQDGEATVDLVRGAFAHMNRLIDKAQRVVDEYERRFEAIAPGAKSTRSAPPEEGSKKNRRAKKVRAKPEKKAPRERKPEPKEAKVRKAAKPSALSKMGLKKAGRSS